ncbi:hypothetical protein ABH942_002145 [Flavobacterium sp. 28YEA47A]|uniref:T9SS type A sorting domain-containing protein n=1 Tax=Flavobacterium sp. 28YEA47A TaxID=3156276 RepID=UPI00351384A1
MKKIYLLLVMVCWQVNSQTLNQSAGWPNPAWTITGTYNSDPVAFESDPRTTPFFAYDDDDAGNSSHEDNIAAESPVIDLTPAFTAGETTLEITVQYGYYYLANDVLRFEYWNAATSSWIPWGSASIPGNNTTVTDNFCTIPKTTYTTEGLNISAFTSAQLTGFRYRIFYDDDLEGPDWNYGFCFSSPTIRSISCGAPTGLAVTSLSPGGATINWEPTLGITGFEYVLNTTSTDPTGAGTAITANTYSPSGLPPSTAYYFHIRTICATSQSPWRTVTFTTSPANDNCSGAIALTVNPNLTCTVKTSGTLKSATDSGEPNGGVGTPDDDVWYTFVATATSHRVQLSNVTGNQTNLVHEVLEGTCGGGLISLSISDPDTSAIAGLTIGTTYYVRVFSYGSDNNPNTTFDLCIATFPPPPANDNCSGAVTLTINANASCAVVTSGTLTSATDSGEGNSGVGTPNDDVWYKFVATQPVHKISLLNVAGSPTDLVHELLEGTCGGGLISRYVSDPDMSTASGLTVGTTYYVRVFSYSSASGATSTFDVCIGVPPVGSVCGNPIIVTGLPYTTTDNTNLYGDDYDFPNGGSSGCGEDTPNYYLNGDDVVYAYTPNVNKSINIRIPGAPGWSAILVYTSCNDIGTAAIACASGSGSGNREINQLSVTAGTTYYIVLSTWPSPQSFAYTLNITENTCTAPTVTFSRTSNCAVSSGFFVIANITSLGTATSLTVTDNQSSPAQQITAAGNVQFGPYPNNTSVVLTVASNQDANCVVVSPAQNQLACPPVNDNCVNATVIIPTATFSVTDGTNVGATASSTETVPVDCNGYAGGDVWFSVVVPPSGNLTVQTGDSSTGASGVDTVVTVYSGACGSLVQVACDDDGAGTRYSLVSMTGLTPGSTLYLRVYEYGNDNTGAFGISAYDSSLKTTSFDNASFKVYPNPVKNMLHLSYTESMTDVAVFNLLGQQVLTKKINATESQLDMSALAGGTYLVKVNVGNQVKTLKIVKE